jgi:hypothetical protein
MAGRRRPLRAESGTLTGGRENDVWQAVASPYLGAFAAASLLAGCAHLDRSACQATPQAKADIEATVHAFYDALRKEDEAAFRRLTTGAFYAFDAGKRYVGTELVDLVKDAHARGVELNWSVGLLDTKLGCDVAWTAWENSGSAGIAPEIRPVRWLESAVLVRRDGGWKVDFFHSQRAAPQ